MVGPTIVELQAAGAAGTVVSTTGAAVAGAAVAGVVTCPGAAVTGTTVVVAMGATVGEEPTIVVATPGNTPAAVPIGGAAPRSIPVLGRSSAANNAPLAPIKVSAGNTRREKVSLFMIYHQTCSE